jgi:hypothetical protein
MVRRAYPAVMPTPDPQFDAPNRFVVTVEAAPTEEAAREFLGAIYGPMRTCHGVWTYPGRDDVWLFSDGDLDPMWLEHSGWRRA